MPFKPINLIFIAALFAGILFFVLHRTGVTGTWSPALKGACVALLAIWAALGARTLDGWLIVAALALGAVGDVLLETHGMIAGGVAFFGGHLVASWLYWRNREGMLWIVPAVMLATAGCAYWLVATPGSGLGIAVYAAALGLMAGTALASRFAKAGAGLGALLFVSSDLLIFAEQRLLYGSVLPGMLIWPLYVAAQATIARGVVSVLRRHMRYLIDPPNGHAYGFPRRFEGDLSTLDVDSWLALTATPNTRSIFIETAWRFPREY